MGYLGAAIIVMFLATYLLRAAPLVLFRREITSRWIRSFLYYLPFAVLTAMTIPAILFATTSWISGAVGLVVAVAVALAGRSLMTVAISAAVAVWLAELALLMT